MVKDSISVQEILAYELKYLFILTRWVEYGHDEAKRVRVWILKLAFKLVNLSLVYQIALKWSVKIILKIILVQIMSSSTLWSNLELCSWTDLSIHACPNVVRVCVNPTLLMMYSLFEWWADCSRWVWKGLDSLILSLWMKLSLTITL